MTVSELIEKLSELDPNALVILSSDGEGNNYSPLCDSFGYSAYRANSSWSGELVSEEDFDDDPDYYDNDLEEYLSGSVPAIVLYPIN
jgi:hypothetical protein